MKIGATNNNTVSFGSFRVVMPAVKNEQETFRTLLKEIVKVYPETQIKHDKSKRTGGYVRRTIYSIFNITGKNEKEENQIMAAFATAGFQLLEGVKKPVDRVIEGFAALFNPVKIVKENAKQATTLNIAV